MASLYKPTVTTYQLPDGKHRTPDGKRVTKDTLGAVRVSRKSEIWYGKYKGAGGSPCRIPLCSDKTASKQMLAKLVTDAKLTAHGLGDPYADHHALPLLEHVEDFGAALLADGDTAKHVRDTIARVHRVLAGCRFAFVRDLSASAVQSFLADLRKNGRPLVELPNGQEWFTKTEMVRILSVHPKGVSAMLRRHELRGRGNGKARRYSRETVLYLQERLSRGAGIATVNAYLRALMAFVAWLVRDRRTGVNPVGHLSAGNARLDQRHERRALPVGELRLLLQAAAISGKVFRGLNGSDRTLLYATAMGTGFRAGELSSLRPESFDLNVNSPTATVEAAYAKNRQQAVQPLPLDLAEALRDYLADKPKGKTVWPGTWADDAAEMLRTDLETAGIPYRDEDGRVLDFHGLRHSFITLMAQSGIHPKLAQSLARHSTITLTMDRYSHVRLYDQAEALTALPSFLPQASMREAGARAATGTDGMCPEKGSRRLDRALTKPVMSGGRLVITPDSSGEPMASINLLHKSSQPKEIERDCEPVITPDRNAPYRTRTYNPLIKRR